MFSGRDLLVYVTCACFSAVLITCQQHSQRTLRVAAAANMQYAMKDLVAAFTEQTEIPCDLIISSSGKLTAQIMEGAPYDIFLSADMAYPQRLYAADKTYTPPTVYAHGKLVLWTMVDELQPSLTALTQSAVRHIAIANPQTAPYGRAAMDVLKAAGIAEEVSDKLVYGESISQVNQFVVTQSAHFGFTSLSVVLGAGIDQCGQWKVMEEHWHTPLSQGVVLIKHNRAEKERAQQFYNFLFSAEARNLLKDFGYSMSE